MRRPKPQPAGHASDSARIGALVHVTPLGGSSGKVLTGVITNQPTKGKMVILLKDGRAYFGRVSTHTAHTWRVCIEDHVLILPIRDVTLIRLD